MKARDILESEAGSARSFLKAIGKPKRFTPNRDYYIAFSQVPLTLSGTHGDKASYCPVAVYSDGTMEQLDGMYDLAAEADVYNENLGLSGEELENASSSIIGHYLAPIHDAVKQGVGRGEVSGPLGARYWALVYWPSRWNGLTVDRPVQATPNMDIPPLPAD